MKTAIIWYRNDLRVHDHEPLQVAIENGYRVVPVYCFNPSVFAERLTDYKMPKIGAFRARFLLEAANDLEKQLSARGAGLVVKVGKPEDMLPQLAAQYNASVVYASKEVTDEEIKEEEAVEEALSQKGISLNLYWQATLYHLEDLPFPLKAIPDIFTKFRKQVEKFAEVRALRHTPARIPAPTLPKPQFPSLKSLGVAPAKTDSRRVLPFKGGETEGMARLQHYFWETKSLSSYKETRNGLLGADYSSKFSPWLALGCLSPRYIYHKVIEYEREVVQNESTYWLIFELIWRDYFRFIAYKFGNTLFQQGGIKQTPLPLQKDIGTFRKWAEGNTGSPFIDANMRELNATGFMSNRGRQNVASFLVKDLKIDWRWGAAYFESQLIDYDPCSNWGNWNYVAGIGNDPREDRYFNTLSQAKRYDAQGAYIRHWLPELKHVPNSHIFTPSAMSEAEQIAAQCIIGKDYPKPLPSLHQEALPRTPKPQRRNRKNRGHTKNYN